MGKLVREGREAHDCISQNNDSFPDVVVAFDRLSVLRVTADELSCVCLSSSLLTHSLTLPPFTHSNARRLSRFQAKAAGNEEGN